MRLIFILSSFVGLCNLNANAQQVSEWRGVNREGIYYEQELLPSWPEAGPLEVWEFEGIGNGYGSPVFANNRMYIQGEIDSMAFLFAFNEDGNLIWKVPFGKEWTRSFRGSRSTPTVVDSLIYVCSGLGNAFCFNAITGKQLWTINHQTDLQGGITMHGHSESLLVNGNWVYLIAGGSQNNIVALNRFNGKIVWSCSGNSERPAYNAPKLITHHNRQILVGFTAYSLLGIDAKTGQLLWSHAQENLPVEQHKMGNGDTHSNTVLYHKGCIYYQAGDGNGGVKLQLSENGDSITEIWRNSAFDGYMGGLIILEGALYGGTTTKKDLRCLELDSGIAIDSLKIGSGALIASPQHIIYYTEKGTINLINPKPLQVISTFKLSKGTGEHFAHPVIHNKKLYLRRGNIIIAYKI